MLKHDIVFGLSPNHPSRAIREAVFIDEQGFEVEFDDQDTSSYHFTFFEGDKAVACCRMFDSSSHPGFMTLGRVAILKPYRGKHYGYEILEAAEVFAKENHALGIELSAQCRVQPFYEKAGYKAVGDIYLDEYCEHIHMEKKF